MNIQNGKIKKSPNCDLKFLSDEMKKFISNMVERYYATVSTRIKVCIEIAEKCELEMKEEITVSETKGEAVSAGS